jgi:hypothetical protein
MRRRRCTIAFAPSTCVEHNLETHLSQQVFPLQYWDEVHQRAFDHVKATIAKDAVLAYPDYSKVFQIYTDASSKQLGAVITQDNRPIAFFSWKLSNTQCKYSITEIELLAIVKILEGSEGCYGART